VIRMAGKLATAFKFIAQDKVARIKGAFSRMSFFPTGFGIVNSVSARRCRLSRPAQRQGRPIHY
jgi:hypothetical protein